MSDGNGSFSQGGMTEAEAKEFHGWMVAGTVVYILFAVVAHALIFSYRPWFQ